MKILYVTDNLWSGGKQRQLAELIKGLAVRDDIHCWLAVTASGLHYTDLLNQDIQIRYLARRTKKDPAVFYELSRLCRAVRPDIIHTWDSMTSIYALPICKLMGIKMVNGMIRDAPPKPTPRNKHWLRAKGTFPFSDAVISNSLAGLRSYGPPPRKSFCIRNGFDFARTQSLQEAATVRERFSIETPSVVGMVASFSHRKDYATFFEAARIVLERSPDVTFLAIGDGPGLAAYRSSLESDYPNRIKCLGRQNDVESIVNTFDVGVLATYDEAISNAIIEYMALGKPVVATRCDGTRELVDDGKSGFLVQARRPGEMALCVARLLEDKHLASKMGAAGRERIRSEFNFEKMVNRFFQLYKDVLNGTRG